MFSCEVRQVNLQRALDFLGICKSCLAGKLCSGNHGPCLAAAEGVNDSEQSGIISPHDQRLHDWMADLGGTLELDYSPPTKLSLPLPAHIPVLERQARGTRLPRWPAYGLHIDTALTLAQLDLAACARDLRSYFAVPSGTLMILFPYGRDYLLEEVWARRKSAHLLDKLREARFDLIVAPNFSVYLDQPRMTHLIRIRMSHVFYRDMMQAGLPVIPHIYFGASEDIQRWAGWFAANPQVTVAACNLQTATDDSFFSYMLDGLCEIAKQAGRPVHYVLSGPSSDERLAQVFGTLGPNVTIANCVAHQVAANRHVLYPNGQREYSEGEYHERLAESIASMDSLVSQARLAASIASPISTVEQTSVIGTQPFSLKCGRGPTGNAAITRLHSLRDGKECIACSSTRR